MSELPTRALGTTGFEIMTVGFGAWAAGGGGWAFGLGQQDDEQSLAGSRWDSHRGLVDRDAAARARGQGARRTGASVGRRRPGDVVD